VGAAVVPAAAIAVGGWWLARRPAPPRSVAVLPFANLTGDPAQDLVADGLAEEVRSALARLPALQVTARTSSDLFRGAPQDTTVIARRLGVTYLLEGAVQKGAGVLRIGAHLVQGADGFERWSQTFDGPSDNLLALESDIAARVAAALQVKLLGGAGAAPGGTRSPQAYQAYLQARRLYDAGGDEASLRTAVTLYEQALALDPSYADAQAGRARTLMAIADQYVTGETRRSLSDQGLAAAEAAARLAPDAAETQAALGFARMGRLDVKGARGPYELAGKLGAGDADRLQGYGAYEARIGRFELAMPALRRAVLLDPLNPNAHLTLGDVLYLARRPSEAPAPLARALELNRAMTFAHSRLGDCRLLAGDVAGALNEYRAEPDPLYRLTGQAIALQRQGQTAAAQAALGQLVAQTGDNGLYQQAQALAQWGRAGPCLDTLERGFALKDSGLTRMKVDPMLDPVRGEPRFARLLSRLNFA
jgi:TolB-like protein